ncbi:MAG: alpha/beta hydrolase [Bacteroidota bacterium]
MLYYKTYHLREDAEWIVFVHGAGGSIITWKYQVEAFKPYFNLLLVDMRDHGKSKNMEPEYEEYNFDIVSEDILEVIDHVGIKKAHFMSLSLGSVVLQRINERRPELVDKMIMAGGVFKADIKIKLFVHSAKFLNHFLPYRVMYDLFSLIVLPRKNHRNSRRIFRLQSQKLAPKEYLKWVALYKEFFKLLSSFFNRELNKLSLIVMGDEDHVFFKAAKHFVGHHKKASLLVIEQCGHICNIEKYDEFNQKVLAFLLGNKFEFSNQ